MNERRIGELLGELPPPPAGWIRAAQELPRARREIGRLAALAQTDADVRASLLADAPSALCEAGLEPAPRTVAALHARLWA
jgi:hypothetical protein